MIKDKLKQIIKEKTGHNLDSHKVRNSRKREYVEARGIYYTILNDEGRFTLSAIGRDMGKTHAIVLHAVRNFAYWLEYNKSLNKTYKAVLAEFKAFMGIKLQKKLSSNIELLMDHYVKLKADYEMLKEQIDEVNQTK